MSKIFDKKDVITCINAEDAKKYIGKLGYFANGLNGFADIDYFAPYSLDDVQVGIDKPFFYKEKNFALFLPEDKVKEVEKSKKYRPFTLDEFNKVIPMGTVFKYRYKSNDAKDVYSVYYHANLDCENGHQAIFFEDSYHDFDYCFYEMKLFLNGRWQPFGVEE